MVKKRVRSIYMPDELDDQLQALHKVECPNNGDLSYSGWLRAILEAYLEGASEQ